MSVVDDALVARLREQVSLGVQQALRFVLRTYDLGDVFAFVLYTDDAAGIVGWAANTHTYYAQHAREFDDAHTQQAMKWYYPEFAVGQGEGTADVDAVFNTITGGLLVDAEAYFTDDNAEQFQADIFDAIIDGFDDGIHAMSELSGDARESITFFVSIADSDDAVAMENYSVQKLNSEPVAQAFVQRFD